MNYLDTSALVKFYGKEEFEKGFAKVKDLVEQAKAGNETLIYSIEFSLITGRGCRCFRTF